MKEFVELSDHLEMDRGIRRTFLFALAGILSAIFTASTENLAPALFWFYPGIVFGIAIVAVLALHDRVRSPFKLGAFVMAATAAFPIAIITALGVHPLPYLGWDASFHDPNAFSSPLPASFSAGATGALTVLAAALFLFGTGAANGRIVGLLVGVPVAGGALGAMGWLVSESVAGPLKYAALYSLWQTGVALCLAIILPERPDPASARSPVRSSVPVKAIGTIFLAAIVALAGWLFYRNVQPDPARTARRSEQRIIDEAPLAKDLAPVASMQSEQALIVEDIGKFSARALRGENNPARPGSPGISPPMPAVVTYAVAYDPVGQQNNGSNGVMVIVDQYPNAAWAQYRSKYPDVARLGMMNAGEKMTKLANRIYVYPPLTVRQPLRIFHWPSGVFAVNLRSQLPPRDVEEVLRRYLEKYPSSL